MCSGPVGDGAKRTRTSCSISIVWIWFFSQMPEVAYAAHSRPTPFDAAKVRKIYDLRVALAKKTSPPENRILQALFVNSRLSI